MKISTASLASKRKITHQGNEKIDYSALLCTTNDVIKFFIVPMYNKMAENGRSAKILLVLNEKQQ